MTLDSMNSSNDHYTEFDPTTGEIAIHTSKNDPSITFPPIIEQMLYSR